MKQLFLFILSVSLFSACTTFHGSEANTSLLKQKDHSFQKVEVNAHQLSLEVVNTEASTTQGLSGRTELPGAGMLFAFPETGVQRFWMKDMQFNLDIIWLKDLKVVDISRNVPKPNPATPLNQLPVYSPAVPVNEVIETTAGTVDGVWQVKVGDSFTLIP